jgi:hypothetical protein
MEVYAIMSVILYVLAGLVAQGEMGLDMTLNNTITAFRLAMRSRQSRPRRDSGLESKYREWHLAHIPGIQRLPVFDIADLFLSS